MQCKSLWIKASAKCINVNPGQDASGKNGTYGCNDVRYYRVGYITKSHRVHARWFISLLKLNIPRILNCRQQKCFSMLFICISFNIVNNLYPTKSKMFLHISMITHLIIILFKSSKAISDLHFRHNMLVFAQFCQWKYCSNQRSQHCYNFTFQLFFSCLNISNISIQRFMLKINH